MSVPASGTLKSSRPSHTPSSSSAEIRPGTGWATIAKGKHPANERVIPGMSVVMVDSDKKGKRKRRRGKRGGARRHSGDEEGEQEVMSGYVAFFERHQSYLEARRENRFPVLESEMQNVTQLQPNHSSIFAYVDSTATLFGPFVFAALQRSPEPKGTALYLALVPSVVSVHSVVLDEPPSRALKSLEVETLRQKCQGTAEELEEAQSKMGSMKIGGVHVTDRMPAVQSSDGHVPNGGGWGTGVGNTVQLVQPGMDDEAYSSMMMAHATAPGFAMGSSFLYDQSFQGDVPSGHGGVMHNDPGFRGSQSTAGVSTDLFGRLDGSEKAQGGSPLDLGWNLQLGTSFSPAFGMGRFGDGVQHGLLVGDQSSYYTQPQSDETVQSEDLFCGTGGPAAEDPTGATATDPSSVEKVNCQETASDQQQAPNARRRTALLVKGKWNRVTVCHTQGTFFWVHEDEQSASLAAMEVRMAQAYQGHELAHPQASRVEPEMWFAAPYGDATQDDVTWTRVQIQKIANEHVLVSHVDYGSMDTLPVSALRPLDLEFTKLSAQAIKCQLHDLPPLHPADPTGQAKSHVMSMTLNSQQFYCSVLHISNDGVSTVDLWTHNIEQILPRIQAAFAHISGNSVMGPNGPSYFGYQQSKLYGGHGEIRYDEQHDDDQHSFGHGRHDNTQGYSSPLIQYGQRELQSEQRPPLSHDHPASHVSVAPLEDLPLTAEQNPWGPSTTVVRPQDCAGFVVHVSAEMLAETLGRMLFGMPAEFLPQMMADITPDATAIYLYNIDGGEVHGTFQSVDVAAECIERDAFAGEAGVSTLPAQVKVKRSTERMPRKVNRLPIGKITASQVAELERSLAPVK